MKDVTDYKILLVEDDFLNMKLVEHILNTEGYTILKATTAQEALQQIETTRPDLILMDVKLPDMDGTTVVRIIRERASTKDTLILALTACAMKGDRENILKSGCDGYISKPINVQEFTATVRSYLASIKKSE